MCKCMFKRGSGAGQRPKGQRVKVCGGLEPREADLMTMGGDGVVVGVRGLGREGVQDIHALGDVAEDGVLAVKIGHRLEADVELAAARSAGRG